MPQVPDIYEGAPWVPTIDAISSLCGSGVYSGLAAAVLINNTVSDLLREGEITDLGLVQDYLYESSSYLQFSSSEPLPQHTHLVEQGHLLNPVTQEPASRVFAIWYLSPDKSVENFVATLGEHGLTLEENRQYLSEGVGFFVGLEDFDDSER